jgi:Glycogen debranching enzyme N terminal
VANGLGGYASATVTGTITRRYHGFLIAAQPAPLGRMVVLNDIEVDVELEDGSVVNLREKGRFLDFTLSMGLPSWRYELDGLVIEKSIVVPSRNPTRCPRQRGSTASKSGSRKSPMHSPGSGPLI